MVIGHKGNLKILRTYMAIADSETVKYQEGQDWESQMVSAKDVFSCLNVRLHRQEFPRG